MSGKYLSGTHAGGGGIGNAGKARGRRQRRRHRFRRRASRPSRAVGAGVFAGGTGTAAGGRGAAPGGGGAAGVTGAGGVGGTAVYHRKSLRCRRCAISMRSDRAGFTHGLAGILALQTANRLDRRGCVVRLMLTVRQPEQRFGFIGFFRVGCCCLEFLNRANPLFVGNQILRALHPLRFGRSRLHELRREKHREDQRRPDSPSNPIHHCLSLWLPPSGGSSFTAEAP